MTIYRKLSQKWGVGALCGVGGLSREYGTCLMQKYSVSTFPSNPIRMCNLSSCKEMKCDCILLSQMDVTNVDQACSSKPHRNSPRVAVFVREGSRQYFVICEQRVLCEVPSLPLALFVTFSAYYVFNLDYPKQAKPVFFFFQDYVMGFPDSFKRPSTYIAVASDIKRCL